MSIVIQFDINIPNSEFKRASFYVYLEHMNELESSMFINSVTNSEKISIGKITAPILNKKFEIHYENETTEKHKSIFLQVLIIDLGDLNDINININYENSIINKINYLKENSWNIF